MTWWHKSSREIKIALGLEKTPIALISALSLLGNELEKTIFLCKEAFSYAKKLLYGMKSRA